MLRAGVIGVGKMGAHHARVYSSLAGHCRLAAVYDPDAERAAALAGQFGAHAAASLDELLETVDVVSIASPTRFHCEQALVALERGADVLIEKPAAATVKDARRLERAAARIERGPIVQVGHIEHFNPAVRELQKILAEEDVIAIEMQRLGPHDPRGDDIDVVQDLMLHDVHVLLTLVDAPLADVQAVGRPARMGDPTLDYCVANLVFENGVIATLSASRVTEEKIRRLTASTRSAHVTVDYNQRTIAVNRLAKLRDDHETSRTYRQESVVERVFVPMEEPLVAQLRSFLECAAGRRAPEVSLADGVRCLEVVEAVRTQVEAGARRVEALAA